MDAPYFVDRSALGIVEHRAGFYFASRLEKCFRRQVLREGNPDSRIVKRICGFAEPVEGLGRVTIRTPSGGRALYFRAGSSDENIIRDIFHDRVYSLEKLARWSEIRELLARAEREMRRPLIVDAGANIGVSAVFFATTFPTATVIAIEPEDENFKLLCENTRGLRVTCLQAALSSSAGRVEVLDPGDGPWAYRTQRVDDGSGPPCTTVDRLFEQRDTSLFPFLVKIDIEGAEADVFSQNTTWLGETPVLIIELHDWMLPGQGSAIPFLRCVSALDRDFVSAGENVFSIDNAFAGLCFA